MISSTVTSRLVAQLRYVFQISATKFANSTWSCTGTNLKFTKLAAGHSFQFTIIASHTFCFKFGMMASGLPCAHHDSEVRFHATAYKTARSSHLQQAHAREEGCNENRGPHSLIESKTSQHCSSARAGNPARQRRVPEAIKPSNTAQVTSCRLRFATRHSTHVPVVQAGPNKSHAKHRHIETTTEAKRSILDKELASNIAEHCNDARRHTLGQNRALGQPPHVHVPQGLFFLTTGRKFAHSGLVNWKCMAGGALHSDRAEGGGPGQRRRCATQGRGTSHTRR